MIYDIKLPGLSEKENAEVERILLNLSFQERQCFLLHTINLWSYQQIADAMGISKSTVQKYMERAKKKIQDKR